MGFSCRTKTAVASCSYYLNCRLFREKGEDSKYVYVLQKNRRIFSGFFFLFFSPPGTLGNSGNFLVVITSWEYSVWY